MLHLLLHYATLKATINILVRITNKNPEDIANMAVFLLSQEAHKISGQVMTVDGNTERMN